MNWCAVTGFLTVLTLMAWLRSQRVTWTLSPASVLLPGRLVHSLAHAAARISVANFWIKLGVLCSLCLCGVAAGGLLYRQVTGADLYTSTFIAYGVLYRAPGFTVRQDTLAATAVLNVLFLFGLFVFAVLIGFIGDEIKHQFKLVRAGNTEVHLQSHILVLNWNALLVPLLRQLTAAYSDRHHAFHKRPVVILADRHKASMDAELAEALKNERIEVHARSGRPHRQADLVRAGACQAATVIVLHPSGCSQPRAAEALKAATVVSLSALNPTAGVVVQMPARVHAAMDYVTMLQDVTSVSCVGGSIRVVELLDQSLLDRLIVQTALQPGVASVYRELVRQGPDAVQFKWCDVNQQLVGKYGHLWRQFDGAVLCGILSGEDASLQLNPDDDTVVHEGDKLIGLTRAARLKPRPRPQTSRRPSVSAGLQHASHDASFGGSTCNGLPDVRTPSLGRLSSMAGGERYMRSTGRSEPLRIIVAGCTASEMAALKTAFMEYAPLSTHVVFMLQTSVHNAPGGHTAVSNSSSTTSLRASGANQQPEHQVSSSGPAAGDEQQQVSTSSSEEQDVDECSRCSFRTLSDPFPTSAPALIRAGIANAHAVVLGGDAELSEGEADACQTCNLLAAQQALVECAAARAPHVVAKMRGYNMRRTVQSFLGSMGPRRAFSFELLIADEYVSAILTQVAENPHFAKAIDELLARSSPGCTELFIHPVGLYGILPGTRASFSSVCEAARKKHHTALGYRFADGRLVLVPQLGEEVVFEEDDRVVVMAGLL